MKPDKAAYKACIVIFCYFTKICKKKASSLHSEAVFAMAAESL